MMCGGASQNKIPEGEELAYFIECKAIVEAAAGASFETFTPVAYTSQVVAGTNFQVKYNVGDSYVHAKIFRPLPHTGEPASVSAFAAGQTADSAFDFWEYHKLLYFSTNFNKDHLNHSLLFYKF